MYFFYTNTLLPILLFPRKIVFEYFVLYQDVALMYIKMHTYKRFNLLTFLFCNISFVASFSYNIFHNLASDISLGKRAIPGLL